MTTSSLHEPSRFPRAGGRPTLSPSSDRREPQRHLPGARPTRTVCGASIAWCNVTADREQATCPVCIGASS